MLFLLSKKSKIDNKNKNKIYIIPPTPLYSCFFCSSSILLTIISIVFTISSSLLMSSGILIFSRSVLLACARVGSGLGIIGSEILGIVAKDTRPFSCSSYSGLSVRPRDSQCCIQTNQHICKLFPVSWFFCQTHIEQLSFVQRLMHQLIAFASIRLLYAIPSVES